MLLLAAAILPLLLVASVLIWHQAVDQRADTERALLATAQATSLAVDRQIASYGLMLEALAQSELLDRGDFASFHAYAKRVADAQGAAFVSMFDPAGRHLLNTARPYGAALGDPFNNPQPSVPGRPPAGDVSSLQRVFQTARPSNSDLFVGLTTQRVQFTVDVPVIRHGKVVYALNAAFAPDKVTELLANDLDTRRVRGAVVDRRGFIAGRWADAQRYVGVQVRPETLEMLASGESGSAFTHSVDGTYVFRVFVRSKVTGWATMVSIDAGDIRRAEMQTWMLWGSAGFAALLLSLLLASRLARNLARSIGRLADAASADAAPGDYGLRSSELDRLSDALRAAKESRDAALNAREGALRAEAQRVEAEAANREKDRFMAAVVHELRTPLAALANVTTLMEAGSTDPRVAEIAKRQVGQLTRVVDDLLETSRLDFDKFHLRLAHVDLRAVVTEAVEATALRHCARNQAIHQSLPSEPVIVEGDGARLTQVVGNLVDNALKFTPEGEAIRVELRIEAGHAVLSVIDSGPGIDPQFVPHVFDRFSQAAGTRAAGEGLGLGLAVARDLVVAHRGRIEVDSAGSGSGARFTVILPLAAPIV